MLTRHKPITPYFSFRFSILSTSVALCLIAILSIASQVQANQYGIAFVNYSNDGYASVATDRELTRIANTGVEWTNLVVPQMMDDITSTTIYRSSNGGITPTDESLVHAIEKAHSLGLKVMLYPHLELGHDPDHWFGEIGKDFNTEQWSEWFDAYTQFILHYADFAEDNDVEQLSIGMELMYAEKQEAHWRKLISVVRQRYRGALIYAENYQTETYRSDISNVNWWDALDYIGIDAYYDLVPEAITDPSLDDMLEAWKPIVARLEKYSKKWDKPILIPELGYRSVKGVTHHPWDNPHNRPADLQEQENAYRAFYQSFIGKPWFAGVIWWAHSTHEPKSVENTRYSPLGKPAENVIREYLKPIDSGDCHSTFQLPRKSWRMISIPCDPPASANTLEAVFGDDELGDYGSDWVVYRYSADVSNYVKESLSSELEQGRGYWIISTAVDANLDLPKGSKKIPASKVNNSAVCQSDEGCFSLPVFTDSTRTQWNLLGHPFLTQTAISGLRILTTNEASSATCSDEGGCTILEAEADAIFSSRLWKYSGAADGYVALSSSDKLTAWDGFWAAAFKNEANEPLRLLIPINE
jgi:hypothetical protein